MVDGGPSQQAINEILDRLTNDSDFREQVLGDPVGAFKPYGIAIDPSNVPAARQLPSREELAAAGANRADVLRARCHMVFFVLK